MTKYCHTKLINAITFRLLHPLNSIIFWLIMITLSSGVGQYITLNDKVYSYFAGNNYLGLANHPVLVKEAVAALKKYGINFAASRQTTGTSEIHLELEKCLAKFKEKEDSMVFASGYLGNKILMHALRSKYDGIFTDSMAHASIRDGIPASTGTFYYNHCDVVHLEQLLKKSGYKQPLIITDGVFALTGEIAPLDRLYELSKKYHAIIITDDAHASGVLGKTGKGTPEHFGLEHAGNIYQSETMSKALGSYGGFITGTKKFICNIRSTSAFYGASTALPPPVVAAGQASVLYIMQHPERREQLKENAKVLREGIIGAGFETSGDITPIIPVLFRKQEQARSLSSFLEKNLIIAPAVDYPVKTDKFIVRITVSACHTREQIARFVDILTKY